MCGIGGFLVAPTAATRNELEARLWAMIATLRHRGPDDEGVWTDGRAGLAHARLSIIDLSPAGHQPMSSADGRVWLTYNGEIYNFAEIARRARVALGYVFRSRSDTEVIANGWHAWGRGCSRPAARHVRAGDVGPPHRSGWSWRATGSARSRSTTRATADSASLFGSEIKAVLAWPGMPRRPNLGGDRPVSDALHYVPAPDTAFVGIRKLPPAHYSDRRRGCATAAGASREPVRYWRLPEPPHRRVPARPAELRARARGSSSTRRCGCG